MTADLHPVELRVGDRVTIEPGHGIPARKHGWIGLILRDGLIVVDFDDMSAATFPPEHVRKVTS